MSPKHQRWTRKAAIPACAILMFAILVTSPILAAAAPILRTGSTGQSVSQMQQALLDLGFNPGPVDGKFGPKTDAAVRAFQTSVKVDVDGICGSITWAALDRSTSDTTSRGTAVSGATSSSRTGVLTGKVITIDPGHGGPDPGAVSVWGDKEKDFTLAMGTKVKDNLEALGAKVIFTRYDDYAPGSDWGFWVDELAARASLANTNNSDLFVSIHVNSYPQDTGISGTMGFYRKDSSSSQSLARSIAKAVSTSTGLRNIDTQVGPYYVLNHTTMPAALIEVGFMTNWTDVSNLRTSAFTDKVAAGIVNGILDYLGK